MNHPTNSDRTGKFALQWIQQDPTRNRSMNTVRFNVREIQCAGGQGLTCEGLHLDRLLVWYIPNDNAKLVGLFQGADTNLKTWRAETKIVNVCVTPGERYTLLTRSKTSDDGATVTHPTTHLTYSGSLHETPYTGGLTEDYWCRTYTASRDSPVARNLNQVTELQLDLLWPLLQGDADAPFPFVPEYRLERVLAEFSYH